MFFLFFSTLGGQVGVSEASVDFFYTLFFTTLLLVDLYTSVMHYWNRLLKLRETHFFRTEKRLIGGTIHLPCQRKG